MSDSVWPIDGSPPGSPVPGILQARTLEWVAISLSITWKWKVKVKSLSRVQLLATSWTAAYQAPLSMGFSGKSTGVGCHCLLHEFANEHEKIRYIYIYTHHIFFINLSINGWLGCFHILATENNTAINMGCICLFKLVFLFSSDQYPEMELLNHL